MKEFFIFLIALLLGSGAMAQWFPQNSGTTKNLNSVYFTDANTGYAVGDSGVILETMNGGSNWDLQFSGTTHNLKSIHFPTNQTGYIVGDSSTILKTNDYGTTWNILPNTMQMSWKSVFFTDINTGYAVGLPDVYIPGDSSKIFKTTDGGINWNAKSSGTSVQLNAVHFADSDTGYVVGGYSGPEGYGGPEGYNLSVILKTTNGGDSWNIQVYDTGYYALPYHSVFFVNPNIGYVLGTFWWGSVIRKTTDGGNNWTEGATHPDQPWLISVFFLNADTGFAVGYGIYRTTNGGTDWWAQESSSFGYPMQSVFFTSDEVGYSVGQPGVILKTTNGGGNPVGINNQNITASYLTIYPNPSSATITIELPDITTPIKNIYLTIYNLNGKQLLRQPIMEPQTVVDISGLKAGIYFVKVISDDGVMVGKFLKE